jgi:hypothetical protein
MAAIGRKQTLKIGDPSDLNDRYTLESGHSRDRVVNDR